jgi:hypothetical protein
MDIVQPPSPAGLFQFSSLTDLPGTRAPDFRWRVFPVRFKRTIDLQESPIRPRPHSGIFIQDDWKAT